MIDFSDCKVNLCINYPGYGSKKACISYKNENYMIKSMNIERLNSSLETSNSCVSEFVACNIINALGYEAQETLMGRYKNKLVVACKDFTENGKYKFYDFLSLNNNILFSSSYGKDTELKNVLSTLAKQSIVDSKQYVQFFWKQFIIDFYLVNQSRDNSDWGHLCDKSSGKCKIAPIFSCGNSIYPYLSYDDMKNILSNEDKMIETIYNSTISKYKYNGNRINYVKFLSETDNPDCLNAIEEFISRYNNDVLECIVNDLEVPNVYKEFINSILKMRYERLILSAAKCRA